MANSVRAPKQWCLKPIETVNTFENWRQNLQYILALDSNFAPFLGEDVKWEKKDKKFPTRGLSDDGPDIPQAYNKTAAQKVALLDLMLGQIANYAPVVSRNTIIKKCISLEAIWETIRAHYHFQSTGARFLDFAQLKLEPGERPEDLYQRLVAFVEDSLLRKDGRLKHNEEMLDEDEEMTPTLENLVVLIWLRLIHSDLPRLVQQRYGTELRSRTLATIKPEISLALESLLDELQSTQEVKAMRAATAHARVSSFRPQKVPSPGFSTKSKSCPICKQAGRPDFKHLLSTCTFLPESDRKFMARARALQLEDDDLDLELDHNTGLDSSDTPCTARRVAIEGSPYIDLFFSHHSARLTLDSGATGNLIRASFAHYVGAPIKVSSQSVHQADGHSTLTVLGETKISLTREDHTFMLEALVVESLDVDILAGVPFMLTNDIALRPAKRQVILSDGTVLGYGHQPSRTSHVVRRAQAHVLRAPSHTTTLWPGDFLEVPIPVDKFPDDDTFALEPRADSTTIQPIDSSTPWPSPSIIQSVGGKVRIPNLTSSPLIVKRNVHFCQVRPAELIDERSTTPTAATPCPAVSVCKASSSTGPPSTSPNQLKLPYHCDIKLDLDGLMDTPTREQFAQTHQEFSAVFNPQFHVYNGAVGPFEATVNMGPTQPPQRKGHIPLYGRNNLSELQDKFDELEHAGVFQRPEDIGITVEYLNPSFLVKKSSGGFRLVTAFADVGRYSKPQPSLMPNVDSTIRTIGQWKYLIVTDLKNAFFQIPLSRNSMKYCGVVTPFKGVRVYARLCHGDAGIRNCPGGTSVPRPW